MKIDLDQNALKELISESIFNSFTAVQKEVMVKSALQHLMTPDNSAYSRNKQPTSPIQDAFNFAVSNIASKLAHETLENNEEVKTKINELIQEGVIKAFTTNREETVGKIAEAVTRAFTNERY